MRSPIMHVSRRLNPRTRWAYRMINAEGLPQKNALVRVTSSTQAANAPQEGILLPLESRFSTSKLVAISLAPF